MLSRTAISSLIVASVIATAGGLAYAKSSGSENDAIADLAKAKITLSQAVTAAEAHAGGKAVKAELEGERGTVVFDVEIVTPDNKVFDVKLDAADGKVLSSKPDEGDRGEKDDD
jgi:uncharacterized membrane protein YkoI